MSEEPAAVKEAPKTLPAGIVKAMRPRQWVKNVLVLAAPMAAGSVTQLDVLLPVALAFVVFCMAASGIYLVNDALDVEADRAHPTKRFRPIAAGILPIRLAYMIAVGLLVASILLSFLANWQLAVVMAVYIGIQLAYSIARVSLTSADIADAVRYSHGRTSQSLRPDIAASLGGLGHRLSLPAQRSLCLHDALHSPRFLPSLSLLLRLWLPRPPSLPLPSLLLFLSS